MRFVAMRYSPNRQVRVRVEPVGIERGGVAQVFEQLDRGEGIKYAIVP